MNKTCYVIAVDSNWVDKNGEIHTHTSYVGYYSSGMSVHAELHAAQTFSSIKAAKSYFNHNKKAILENHSPFQISHPRVVRVEAVKDYTSLLF